MSFVYNVLNLQNTSATIPTPISGYMKPYTKLDGKLYWKDDTGTEKEVATTTVNTSNPSKSFVISHLNDVPGTTSYDMCVATGPVVETSAAAVNEHGVWQIASGTTVANSLAKIWVSPTTTFVATRVAGDGYVFEAKANMTTTSAIRVTAGFSNVITTATSSVNDEISFRIVGSNDGTSTSAYGVCDYSGAETLTASYYSLTAGVPYYYRLVIAPDRSSVTFKVLSESGTQLWTDTVSSNIIPNTTTLGVRWTQFKSTTTPASIEMTRLDYIGFGHSDGYKSIFGVDP